MATRTVTTLPVEEFNIGDGNWDAKRSPIDIIVIHTIVGTVASAIARFQKPNEQASAHYIVGKDGKIYHGVDEDKNAYHAGNYEINLKSIGIEHEDNGMVNGEYDDGERPDALYASSAKLVADICAFYSIPIDREHIKKHSEVSKTPTACPDALNIDRIVTEAKGSQPTPPPVPEEPIGAIPKKVVVRSERGLNGRSAPKLDAPIITAFNKGTQLETVSAIRGDSVSDNNIWYLIKEPNLFIWSGGVEVAKEEKPKEPKPAVEDKDKIIAQLQKENKKLLETIKKLNEITDALIPEEKKPEDPKEEGLTTFENLLGALHIK